VDRIIVEALSAYYLIVSLTFYVATAAEQQLLESLPISQQCPPEEAELVHFCYNNLLKKVSTAVDVFRV
jgi:hypothetical protein